jgi:hypothetical protein
MRSRLSQASPCAGWGHAARACPRRARSSPVGEVSAEPTEGENQKEGAASARRYSGGQPLNSPTLVTERVERFRFIRGFIEEAPLPLNRSSLLPLIAPPTSEAYQ